MCNTLNVQLQM